MENLVEREFRLRPFPWFLQMRGDVAMEVFTGYPLRDTVVDELFLFDVCVDVCFCIHRNVLTSGESLGI